MNLEKKFIQVFKNFVEKALLPQIKKFDGSLIQWNKFSTLLSADNFNFSELQLYVDTLPPQGSYTSQKSNGIKKQLESQGMDFGTFNPSKTFGGERNKLNIFQVSEENAQNQQRQDSRQVRSSQNPNNIISGLQKLLKSLQENQSIFDNFSQQTFPKQPTSATVHHQTLPTHTISTNSAKVMGRQNQSYGGYNQNHTNSTTNNYSYQNQGNSNQAYYKSYH